jgi:hypothetical protein
MKGLKRVAVCGTASILALATPGCDLYWVNIMIRDFRPKKVQGVWVWFSSRATGGFSHDLQVVVPAQIVPPATTDAQEGEGAGRVASKRPSAVAARRRAAGPRESGWSHREDRSHLADRRGLRQSEHVQWESLPYSMRRPLFELHITGGSRAFAMKAARMCTAWRARRALGSGASRAAGAHDQPCGCSRGCETSIREVESKRRGFAVDVRYAHEADFSCALSATSADEGFALGASVSQSTRTLCHGWRQSPRACALHPRRVAGAVSPSGASPKFWRRPRTIPIHRLKTGFRVARTRPRGSDSA